MYVHVSSKNVYRLFSLHNCWSRIKPCLSVNFISQTAQNFRHLSRAPRSSHGSTVCPGDSVGQIIRVLHPHCLPHNHQTQDPPSQIWHPGGKGGEGKLTNEDIWLPSAEVRWISEWFDVLFGIYFVTRGKTLSKEENCIIFSLQGLTVSDDEMTIITAHQRARRPRSRDHQLEADSTTIKKVREQLRSFIFVGHDDFFMFGRLWSSRIFLMIVKML